MLKGHNAPRLGEIINARLDALATLTDEPGKLTRLYLGPAHREAVRLVSSWMREAGMSVHVDGLGTVVGRYEGATSSAPALLLGSHIDTVPNGGRFDGSLGVVAAIAAVAQLKAQNIRRPFAIEVLAFGDEEGIRFPGTLSGSRAIAGVFDPRALDEVDTSGISRRQALAAFGCDVSAIGAIARSPQKTVGYLEVHIEQGPVLEVEGHAVGIVTAINGATRGRVVVTGEAGHAGTVPMTMRRDAIAAVAEMILAVEHQAKATPDLVATVGVVTVTHGAVNAVSGEASFTLDVRGPSDAQRLAAVQALQQSFERIAVARGVTAKVALTYAADAAACDASLTEALAAAVARSGHHPRQLPSGAGHDAMSFKDRLPFAMLFVRCRGGVSHSPDEFTTTEDIDAAARVLVDFVETYQP